MPLRDITAIVQDRRLDVYVAARRDTTVVGANCPSPGGATQCDLPVIYRIRGLTTGNPQVMDIIWHPFDDGSRRFTRFELPGVFGGFADEDASFTGVSVLADNRLYATRSGPVNSTATGRPNRVVQPLQRFSDLHRHRRLRPVRARAHARPPEPAQRLLPRPTW